MKWRRNVTINASLEREIVTVTKFIPFLFAYLLLEITLADYLTSKVQDYYILRTERVVERIVCPYYNNCNTVIIYQNYGQKLSKSMKHLGHIR
jgi:hypothetical protein